MPGDPGSAASERLDPFASRSRFRELVEQLPVVVYVDTDERRPSTIYISPNIERLLGLPAERFLEDPGLWFRSMHPEDRESFRRIKDEAWSKGTRFRSEYRMVRSDGEEVWLRDSSDLVLSDEGKRMAWQGVIEDLTAEKRSEQDLRDSEARYRALVERVPAVVYEMGPDDERRTLYVSSHVEHVLGYTREEWLDQPDIWIELLHEDDREIVLDRHDRHTQTGEPWDLEYRLIANDGRVVWVHDRGTLIRDRDGRAAAWHGVMIDVTAEREAKEMLLLTKEDLERRVAERTTELAETNELMALEIGERRRIEDELREARERYRRLVEHMPGVAYIWEVRPDAGSRSFTYTSPRIEEVLGFSPAAWNASARVHPHDRSAVTDAARRSATTGETFLMEYRYLARDGRVVWVLDQATLIARDEEGAPHRFQGVMLDITARKEAESKAEQAEDRFRSLTEHGPVVVYRYEVIAGEDGAPAKVEVPYISPQIADLVGYPLSHWMDDPMKWFEMIHPDDRDRVSSQMQHDIQTGEDWAIRYRMIRSDGEIVWLHDAGRTLERDASGRAWRFQGVLIDVTRDQEARVEIETAEAQQRLALEGTKAIPWTELVDPETGTERYTFIGPAALEVFGYRPDELTVERKHFPRMVHPDDRSTVKGLQARADESGIWEGEYRVIRRDGDIRWVRSFGRRVSPPGAAPEVWHGVAVDVTDSRSPAASPHGSAEARLASETDAR
jgi:PAS domain S-box-containing protein